MYKKVDGNIQNPFLLPISLHVEEFREYVKPPVLCVAQGNGSIRGSCHNINPSAPRIPSTRDLANSLLAFGHNQWYRTLWHLTFPSHFFLALCPH